MTCKSKVSGWDDRRAFSFPPLFSPPFLRYLLYFASTPSVIAGNDNQNRLM